MRVALSDQEGDLAPSLPALICSAADLCRKPLIHAAVQCDSEAGHEVTSFSATALVDNGDDLRIRLECRHSNGERCSDQDLELELYRSGGDLHLMLGWWDQPKRPLLWHGQHPVWMNGETGERCGSPDDGLPLEAMARRIRALLV